MKKGSMTKEDVAVFLQLLEFMNANNVSSKVAFKLVKRHEERCPGCEHSFMDALVSEFRDMHEFVASVSEPLNPKR